jgi:hypothetical protein
MPYYYAQIDNNSICFAVTQTSGPIDQFDMIAIDGYDTSLLGKLYDNGQWLDAPESPAADLPA